MTNDSGEQNAEIESLTREKVGLLALVEGQADQIESLTRERDELRANMKKMSDACLCTRNTYGFDYSEKHPKLGKPDAGKRWLTPYDIARAALIERAGGKE